MRWVKSGRIFVPPGSPDWIVTHAMTPFALPLDGGRFRIYIAGRDARGRSQVGFFETDLSRPGQVESLTPKPVIPLGPLGTFDEHGVNASWVVQNEGRLYHYYVGWHLGQTVPFYVNIGLATSDDGGRTFQKFSPAPIIGWDRHDPCLTASPCVLIEDGLWRMWYTSGIYWQIEDGQPKHYYHIKYAESRDGKNWERDGTVCIDFGPGEYAITRPSVIRHDGLYRMWYSYRGPTYRLGYAESADGKRWQRLDERVGIEGGPDEWDSQMIEYPHVFWHRGRLHMFYNGNSYGAAGVGLAALEE